MSRCEVRFLVALVVSLVSFRPAAGAIQIDLVHVGNQHNAPDSTGFGQVNQAYRIGRTEVTNAQYATFLNAVAKTDPYQLYNPSMGVNARGGITRSGSSGNYSYSPRPNFSTKPVNYISFFDAARFTNWLHNGQPTGAQDLTTTEDGAYFLNGATSTFLLLREPDAKWFVPSEDEWYKAAYHQPAAVGGDVDDYWLYPTVSNVLPTPASADAMGNINNPAANVVNYQNNAVWNGATGNVTTVGSAGPLSQSYYGTVDQGGNVSEWVDTDYPDTNRPVRGGVFSSVGNGIAISSAGDFFGGNLASEFGASVGFRVATSLPEPSTLLLLAIGGMSAIGRGRY